MANFPSTHMLVLVNGLPGSGKTTMAKALAAELDCTYLSKDVIKEALFDSLGSADRQWSRTLGAAAIEVLWSVLAGLRGDVIVENLFRPTDLPLIQGGLSRGPERHVLEVLCECPPELALERFFARISAGDRHPGHGHDDPAEFGNPTSDWYSLVRDDLRLGLGAVCRIDTSGPAALTPVVTWVRSHRGARTT